MSRNPDVLSVSVVIPTYNRAATIERAVRSALIQEAVLEVIVVDDGSTDDTREVVGKLISAHPRVRYAQIENSGACAARNHGVSLSTGVLVAFQDSDDEWLPGKLTRQLELRRTAGPSLVSCMHRVFFNSLRTEMRPIQYRSGSSLRRSQLLDNSISTQTILIDRSIVQRTNGFDPRLRRLQDWDLCLQVLALKNIPILMVEEVLVNVYRQDDSITTNGAAYYTALARILRKHWRLFARYPYALLRHSLRVGKFRLLKPTRGSF